MVYGYHQKSAEHFKTFTLPCFSMIATGDCSYESYCRFIHDHRLKCSCMKLFNSQNAQNANQRRPKNYNAGERGFVVFYWPPMGDQPHIPHTHRKYELPLPGTQYHGKDYAYLCMASMWDHFLLFLQQSSPQTTAEGDEGALTLSAYQETNYVTGRSRLPVFRELSVRETRQSVQAKVMLPSPIGITDKAAFATPVNAAKSLFQPMAMPKPMPLLFSPSYHHSMMEQAEVETETTAVSPVMMDEEESSTTSSSSSGEDDEEDEDDNTAADHDKHGRKVAVNRRLPFVDYESSRSRGAGYIGVVKLAKASVVSPPAVADVQQLLDEDDCSSPAIACHSHCSS